MAKESETGGRLAVSAATLGKIAWRRLKRNRAALAAAAFIAVVGLLAVLGDLVSPYPYDYQDSGAILESPSTAHPFGTDRLGRDLLARLFEGTRLSLGVGVISALVALLIGTVYGAISGYVGGRTDNVMMRFVDVAYSFPDLLLIILLSVIIGPGPGGIVLALSLVAWVSVARLVRGLTLQLKEESFIEAARSVGAHPGRILFRHILPNALGPIIVTLTFRIPTLILAESTLSFIGLGIPPPETSWGTLANDGWIALRSYPHLIIFPSLAIFFTILSFNFLGDGLRDALDPTFVSK